jgi:two-component system sensor histidine kinase BaeS
MAMLLTTLIITMFGMGLLHMGMQKGFSRYVAEVEMQRLDGLTERLGSLYQQYGGWSEAMSMTQPKIGKKGADAASHKTRRWLRYQHELTIREFIRQKIEDQHKRFPDNARLDSATVPQLPVPPPFPNNMEAKPHSGSWGVSPESRRSFFASHDRLGLGQRLGLYDKNLQYISGVKDTTEDPPMRAIKVDGEVVGYLTVKPALDPEDSLSINFFTEQSRYLLLIYGACLIVSAIVSLMLAAHFRNPIKALLKTSSELIHGHYNQQIQINRSDELGDLASAMNRLSHILHQHEESRRQWVADTSHELRTPISVLQVQIEALQDGIRKATPTHLEAMQRQVMTLKKLVQDLNELSQADVGQLKCYFIQTNPWFIVQQEIESFQQKFASKSIELEVIAPRASHLLNMDPDRIRQIIMNLLENSWRYTNDQGKVRVSSDYDKDHWYLHIDDTPPGVSDEALKQLGERFYRVDHSRARETGGTGLGLALSKQIAKIHAGHLQFSHSPLGGIRATLSLPLNRDDLA